MVIPQTSSPEHHLPRANLPPQYQSHHLHRSRLFHLLSRPQQSNSLPRLKQSFHLSRLQESTPRFRDNKSLTQFRDSQSLTLFRVSQSLALIIAHLSVYQAVWLSSLCLRVQQVAHSMKC